MKLYTALKADNKQLRNQIIKELKEHGYEPVILEGDHVYADGDGDELFASSYNLDTPPRYILNRDGILTAKKNFGRRAGAYTLLSISEYVHPPILFYFGDRPYITSKVIYDFSYTGLDNDGNINTRQINETINNYKNK